MSKHAPRTKQRQHNATSPIQHDRDSTTITTILDSLSLTDNPSMAQSTRLLVCSIGNPAPYLNTLHSAGHTVLNALLPLMPSNAPFSKSRAYGNGLLSSGPVYTLWQSPSLMNISGPAVFTAWRAFLRENSAENSRLVVVHDELESAPGTVKVRDGAASAKGHNGLKSIKSAMGGVEYTRIGVGIGRPEGREPNVVAGYVLKKMTGGERLKIEGCVGRVELELKRLAGA